MNNCIPKSKNPNIAKVFKEIDYADELGSGIRNLTKYVHIYCGEEPMLEESNIFRTIIPLANRNDLHKPAINNEKVSSLEKSHFETHDFIASRDIQKIFDVGLSQSKEILTKLVNENYLECLFDNRNRKYVLSSSNSLGTHQDKVSNYLQNNSYITKKEAQQLLNLKEDWGKNILNQMVSAGMIEVIENDKGRK